MLLTIMRKILVLCILLLASCSAYGQHTFSIVAVDSVTGEVGSAGATCGDTVLWPGTRGAYIISDVFPGIGAIHTQAQWVPPNQEMIHNQMALGKSPDELIAWITANDYNGNPSIRQYGIVDFRTGSPRVAAYTGSNCMDYKAHIIGPNYAIQGNILLNQSILDSMEARFLREEGSLADKLMAALQGAKVVGADTRCAPRGVSSLSAFLRVARPSDRADSLTLDLNVGAVPSGVDPVDALQTRYNEWRVSSVDNRGDATSAVVRIYPNPATHSLTIEIDEMDIFPDELRLVDVRGKVALAVNIERREIIELDIDRLPAGTYLPTFYSDGERVIVGSSFVVE